MRRFIPRNTDLEKLPTPRLRQSFDAYNNTPRKCLDFRTPAEAFFQLLHFKCESISWLSTGRHKLRRDPVDLRHVVRAQGPTDRLDVLLDLFDAGGAGDHAGDLRARGQP